MARRSITKIGREIGISPGQLRLLFERIDSFVSEDPSNKVEKEGFGIFYKRQDNERLFIRDGHVFKVPERQILAMRSPRRRRTDKTLLRATEWVELNVDRWPDQDSPPPFRVNAGAIQGLQPLTPHTNTPRNITFTPDGEHGVKMDFIYDETTFNADGSITRTPTPSERYIHRDGSAWEMTDRRVVNPGSGVLNTSHLWASRSSAFGAFLPFTWPEFEEMRNPHLSSKFKTFSKALMGILRNDWA